MQDLQDFLQDLAKQGCYPWISLRGKTPDGKYVWRAHVNGAGNFWFDDNTPIDALYNAVSIWKKAGCPMDGYAVTCSPVRGGHKVRYKMR